MLKAMEKKDAAAKFDFKELLKQNGLVIAFIVMMIGFTLMSDRFLTYSNIITVIRQVSIYGIIACGMTYVIIGGNFDLSVGSLVSLVAVVVISLHDTIGPLPAILVGLLVGLASGTFVGYLVGFLKLNSIIITLGMLGGLQGLTLIYTGGAYSSISNPDATWYSFIGRGFLGEIPFPIILYAAIIILFAVVLTKTVYGRQLKAVGGNSKASQFTGIRSNLVVMSTFIASGVTAAIGAIVLSSRIMSAQNYIGEGYEFQVITGVILGGTSLLGGEGSVLKTFLGIVILGFLRNGFILMGFPYYTTWIIQWFIIVGVVWIDVASRRGGKILA